METDKQIISKNTSISDVNTSSSISPYFKLEEFEQIEKLVDKLENSTIAKQFVEKKYQYDKDGNPILETEVEVFNKADMIMCLGLGSALGMTPYVALSYGKNLNLKSVKKIERGKRLGLDYATALENIHIWGDGSKEIIYTSIHIVNKVLTEAGVARRIILDGTTRISYCIEIESGNEVIFNPSIHKDVPQNLPAATLDKVVEGIKEKGFTPVTKSKPLYVAEIELKRFNKVLNDVETIVTRYTSQDATDAGLLKGIDRDGNEVKGKDNWNKHVATHLRKMCIMIGGRTICADKLLGIYSPDEIDFVKTSSKFDSAEDAEIV